MREPMHDAPRTGDISLRTDGLIERVAKGDRSAWAALYERHKREVIALCYGILRNKDDATDAAEIGRASCRERV